MKRILLAVLISIAVAGMAFRRTRAVWTDAVSVSNNKINTGTVDLRVSSNNWPGGAGTFSTTSVASGMVLASLVPGGPTDEDYSFSLRNNSDGITTMTIAAQITGTIVNPTPGVDKSQLMIEIYDMAAGVEVAELPLTTWESGAQLFTATLATGSTRDYGVRARLLSSALNEWQGQQVTFSLDITGSQP
jgi:hypothetical protein